MRYLSVCSGIEAASVAWKPLGWECAGVSEIEAFPRAVLEHRLGAVPADYAEHEWRPSSNSVPLFGDFTKIEERHVGPIDLLVGGTPCQSFSIAGKRLGLDDPRGNLTLEFLALARRVRPRWIVWENVPGVLSHDEGRTMGTFLRLVGECGFRWAYRVLDAQYVRVGRFGRAVPQRRRRVFLVGYSGTGGIDPRAVLFDRESLRGNPAPCRQAGQGVAPTIAARTRGGGGLGTDFDCDGGLIAFDQQAIGEYGDGTTASTCMARDYKDATDLVAHALRAEGFDASEDGTGRGTPIVPVAFSFKDSGNDASDNVSPTLRSLGAYDGNGGSQMAVAFAQNQRGELRVSDVAMQITCGGGKPGEGYPAVAFDMRGRDGGAMPEGPHDTANIRAASGGSSRSYVADTWAVRRLTPTECARLQGFPDDWARIPWRGKPAEQCPDGPQYKAFGNSMAVNVMSWIGERIAAVEAVASPSTLAA